MPTIIIDGVDYEVAEGRNVLQAALDHKLNLPYFCWHPAMGSVGACRLCAVKHYRDETDDHGRIAMGCMTPATDGTRVAIDEPDAQQFRRSIIEWLMINHPHDCPVCDEGGECHLQDMTVMTGHAYRRYRGRKRTYRNQYLGPLIHHEMNRCIQCYRCTRFYRDHTGGDDLGAFASRDRVYFGRVEDGVLESPFSGNLVEVCPTGVFTDKTSRRHYTRKWDLQSAPSVCTHCSLGCNTIMGARYGSVRRVTSRYNGEVNGYWLCDRGRFGYEYLNDDSRLRYPQMRQGDGAEATIDAAEVHSAATAKVAAASDAGRLATVGSPRASLESNFALRALAGPDRFCCGLADAERELIVRYARGAAAGRFHVPSLQQVEDADVVVVLGADLTNEAPLLDLALYRARANGAEIHVIGLTPGRVGAFATNGGEAFGRHDSRAVAARARSVATALRRGTESDGQTDTHDTTIAQSLAASARPLVITGTRHRDAELLDAALELVDAIDGAVTTTPWFGLAPAEANALGVALLDDDRGPTLEALVESIEAGRIDVLVVAENDLFARYPDQSRLQAALAALDALVLLDQMVTPTAGIATHVLPAAAVAESSGTLVNNEGRMQRFFQVLQPAAGVQPSWSLARNLMANSEEAASWRRFEDVTAALERELPAFAGATGVAPPAGFRQAHQPVPRMSHRYSGRNATIERDALDGLAAVGADGELPVVRRASEDPETPLAFTMEGFRGNAPPTLLPRVWAPGWSSNEAINQFQIEVGGPMHGGDPGRRIFDLHVERVPNAGETRADMAEAASPVAPRPGHSATAAGSEQPPAESSAAMGREAAGGRVEGRLLVCATAEIFGSEPTSRRARGLAELMPPNYLRLHPEPAAKIGVAHGEIRNLRLSGDRVEAHLEAAIEIDPTLPAHVATIPAGYPATCWWQRPVWLVIEAGTEVT